MIRNGEALLQALGADAERLHPEIRAQLSTPVRRQAAHGVFEVAGSRFGRLTALGVPLIGADAVVTGFERDVPFSIVTTATVDSLGRAMLDTTRSFRFRRGAQRICDRLTVSTRPGLVRNLLGRAGRIELIEECGVSDRGFLQMRTRRAAVRVLGRRIALRGPLRIDVLVEDGWDAGSRRRTIEMRARNPVVGTIVEYRGWYRVSDAGE